MTLLKRTFVWILLIACFVVPSVFCFGFDLFSAGVDTPPLYWLAIAAGFAPLSLGLWPQRARWSWLFLGVWAGTLVFLPWIPYDTQKRFVRDVNSLRVGMPYVEAQKRLASYHMDPQPDIDAAGNFIYACEWDPRAEFSDDLVLIKVRDGKIIDVDLEMD